MNSALISSTFARQSAIAVILLASAAVCAAQNSSSTQSSSRPSSTSSQSSNYGTQNSTSSPSSSSASSMSSSGEKVGWMDRHWVSKTADNGTDEVALAQLAAQRATSPDVRKYAEQLVKDHTEANNELMQLASSKSIKIDKDDGHGRTYKRLNNKSGADFDREFVEHMVDDHQDEIRRFEKASQDAKDPEIRSFASKTLDHLRHHLQEAQSLQSSLMPTGRENANSPSSYNSTSSSTTPSSSTSSTSTPSSSSSTSGKSSIQSTNTGGTNPDSNTKSKY